MKTKILISILVLMIIGLLVVLVSTFFTYRQIRPVVRQADSPGQSTLRYDPPPPPKISVEALKGVANILKMSEKKIEKVTDFVYLATGYAFGNILMVITDEGLVIIDTTESSDSARKVFAEFRKISDKPVKKIIYTHGHPDHVFGTPVFMQEGTEVISTNTTVEMLKKTQEWLKPFTDRNRAIQAGAAAPEYSPKLPAEPLYKGFKGETLIWPTVTFDKFHSFKLGNKTFELYLTGGEAAGHLIIWMPDDKIAFSGDLFYPSFPNLTTPMMSARSSLDWIHGLEKVISLEPEYLVPSHNVSLSGSEKILTTLRNYLQATRYVFDETVAAVNEGKSVEAAVQDIRLPVKLAELPYLQEYYGRVDWSVRGIYRELTGWYDGWGSGLNPLPKSYLAREVVSMSGGVETLLKRAIELQKKGEHQLACELADLLIQANPEEKTARIVKSYSLQHLAYLCGNLNMFGFYRSAAAMEREMADYKP